jgi:HSP20 family protein
MTHVLEWMRHQLLPLEDALSTARGHEISIEEYAAGGRYVVRAELPGVDPVKQVNVSVYDGSLKIDVERFTMHPRDGSEFRYGAFSRTVNLPPRADDSSVTARYRRGVLEISVRVRRAPPISRRVPVVAEGQRPVR